MDKSNHSFSWPILKGTSRCRSAVRAFTLLAMNVRRRLPWFVEVLSVSAFLALCWVTTAMAQMASMGRALCAPDSARRRPGRGSWLDGGFVQEDPGQQRDEE